jgi:gag-polyprotein putative aspartyl protease
LTSSEWAYAASTPKVKVRLGDIVVDAMLDTGAEVNVMTKGLADLAGLTVRTNVRMGMKAVSGGLSKFAGVCEDVEVNIGGIVNLQTILVIPNLAHHKLILGQPFVHDAQVCPYFDEEGYQCIKFRNEDRSKVGTTRVSKPQGKAVRNARMDREEEEMSGNE